MSAIILSMLTFALVGAISPGPVNIIATSSAANFGFSRALPYVIGATLGYTLIVLLVGIGMNGILQTYPQITWALQYSGGAFLLYMAYRIASARPQQGLPDYSQNMPPRLLEGALAQALNPKAWLVSMSGVALFVSAHTPAGYYLVAFCVISFIMCLFGVGTWAAVGHLVSRSLAKARNQVIFNLVMGLLLSGTVVSLFIH
jgi:threonine/homoserine/homoserine lactone efflux protein